MRTVAKLVERLQALHLRTAETPLFNPVFQLSLDLSREIESGKLSLDEVSGMVTELEGSALESRAQRLRCLVDPCSADDALDVLVAEESTFEAFAARWSRPQMHAVFTAHPTFLLRSPHAEIVARAASGRDTGQQVAGTDECERAITLDYEHDRALDALTAAQEARDRIVKRLLTRARADWPDRWQELQPLPFRFATWVGYDMDGRTDIGWHTSVAYRLAEKAERLGRYAASLREIDSAHPLAGSLQRASDFSAQRAADFSADLGDPADISAAANRLTADHPDKLLSLDGAIARLESDAAADDADGRGERAIALQTLAAAMRADGLGMGWIHFRVNASQLHNAIRRRLPDDQDIDLRSRGAISTLRAMLANAEPLRSNFAALATESSTAIRQFLAMAQILGHVDADAPIRMLIAECEQPATVLTAVYFARLFGIDDKVDVSPLLETETALEHGGRLLDALLAEPAYQHYVRGRGRIALQTGFSDAGRFVGQIPASLAIERLQGRLAAAMQTNRLTDVAALVFNTHGESMGRGAHPSSMVDRLEWPLSPWARGRFARAGVRLEPEASFQGGDGFLFFATPELALATLTRIASLDPAPVNAPADAFYGQTDLSLDFYRAIKDHQRAHLESKTYARAITAFGLGMLVETGSRKSRRQSDVAADKDLSLRQIRAIPHNAVLQQLGYPVNVISGFGSAADGDYDDIATLLLESARGRQMVRLVRAANGLASIKTVAAFGELFNSAYWASRTYRGVEEHLAPACAALAEYLTQDDRNGVFRRLASRLRVDALKLHRLLALIPEEETFAEREQVRRQIGVLQALRLALLQHMFLKAVSIPAFARANDISRSDVMEMVFTLRIDEALAQLRRAYPVQAVQAGDFRVEEPADYPGDEAQGYGSIHRDYIDRIEAAHGLNLRIATSIANLFGAHG